jgi:hypothetical protein
MSKIKYIKDYYMPEEIQHNLTLDSITIFAYNITGTKMMKSGDVLTESELREYVNHFRDELIKFNDLDIEWNQTS